MEIREIVGSKNRFVETCQALRLPLLKTFCLQAGEQFDAIESQLDPQHAYIIKPATDRTRFEDQRRRFYVLQSVGELKAFMASDAGLEMVREAYQIQEYVDFHSVGVAYYNATYLVGRSVMPRLVTQQILNVSAIHQNRDALHWGNASVADAARLKPAIDGCASLVEHYRQAGYEGEIGIDFGMADGECFFLEANARENNGTRLHRQLLELDIDPAAHTFLYMRNIPYELMCDTLRSQGVAMPERVIDCGDRKLLVSRDMDALVSLLAVVDRMTKQEPPFHY